MITLNFNKKKNGVPVLSKDKIEFLAEQVMSSYKPNRNFEAGALDLEHFIESYMDLDMDYKDLSHDRSILGMMVFDNCKIPIYDKEIDKAKYIDVDERTVIIDNSLLEEEQLRRGRFTLAHEAAHWFLHRQIYQNDKNQISLFENQGNRANKIPAIKCRTSDIAYGKKRKLETDDEFIEWQADHMASAMLMPKNAFAKVARSKFKSSQIVEGFYQIGTDFEMDLWASVMAYELADLFEVSQKAANIRLVNLGFIRQQEDQRRSLFE